MRSQITVKLSAAVLALFTALLGGSPASASTSTASFVAQARAAGLTSGQANSLQNKVHQYLAAMGGKQVAPNRIQLDGATVYLTVPGEAHPRDLGSKTGAAAYEDPCMVSANYGHMCAYRKTKYKGDEVDMYSCGRYYFSTWSGPGSWNNNQSTGTVAYMYGPSGAFVYKTPPAHSKDPAGDWTPVHSVVNC